MDTLRISALASCPYCHGEGYVYDRVPMPFGSGDCSMPSLCGCIEEQIPEDTPDEVEILVIAATGG